MGTEKEKEILDWELTQEYYSQDAEEKHLSLEDFIDETSADLNAESGLSPASAENDRLNQVAGDVVRVMELAGQGKTAAEIAEELGADVSYVSDIMVCVQAFPEDNPLAVARLIVMG